MKTMKIRPRKSARVYRVDNLDNEKGIIVALSISKDRNNYATCLCLHNRTEKKVFNCGPLAFDQLGKYKKQYVEN